VPKGVTGPAHGLGDDLERPHAPTQHREGDAHSRSDRSGLLGVRKSVPLRMWAPVPTNAHIPTSATAAAGSPQLTSKITAPTTTMSTDWMSASAK